MKILLGGIPLGCDNIGDEAILLCVIQIFREIVPDAHLTVSTRRGVELERKLGVAAVPLFGFDREHSLAQFRSVIQEYDWYVWAGATGLSDYPAMGCALLETAQSAGVGTLVWNVGMNDQFNPAFFRLGGKKKWICSVIQKMTGFDLAARWEAHLVAKIRNRIANALAPCSLVSLRDQESLIALRHCAPFPDAIVGADSAIFLPFAVFEELPWESDRIRQRFSAASRRVAICLSAQNQIRECDRFAAWMKQCLVKDPDLLFVMIPMNPKTDFELMKQLREKLLHPDRVILSSFQEPEEVQSLVSQCRLTISSRLHLLILSLNAQVPAIGIARGSKVRNYLMQFGLPVAGSVDSIDFECLNRSLQKYAEQDTKFQSLALSVRQEMKTRLLFAMQCASRVLQGKKSVDPV